MTFETLSLLIKNSLIDIQIPSNKENEINLLLEKSKTLQHAGFEGQAKEAVSKSHEISNLQSVTHQLKHWREQGYLTIRIKNMDDWQWRHRINDQLWTYSLPVKTLLRTKTSLFGLISKTKQIVSRKPMLALIGSNEYLAPVPEQILEKAIAFRNQLSVDYPEFATGRYPKIQTFVLTVTDEMNLGNIVREVPNDPILLYRIRENDNHLDLQGNFVVIGWWGADLEDIENTLDLDRSSFPSTSVQSSRRTAQ